MLQKNVHLIRAELKPEIEKPHPRGCGTIYTFFYFLTNIPVPYAINPYVIPQKIQASILAMNVLMFVVINNSGKKKAMPGAKYIFLETSIKNIPKIAATTGIIPIASKKGFT